MKKLLALMITVTLSAIPLAVYSADSGSQVSKPPPVSQELVSEGDFAFQLATVLGLGTPTTEAQAEDILTSVGIAPRNGWIADYPMTPIVVGEVQNAVITAAASKKLPVGKDDALKAFQSLASDFNLAITAATSQEAEVQPLGENEYVEPPVVENYYADEGPPVVTYYPPPWDYGYLYAWVPYPFWCSGFYFPGFYILNDFDVVVGNFHHHGHYHHHDFDHHGHDFDHRITNHFTNPKTHQTMRVDPTMKTRGSNVPVTRTAAFSSQGAKRGAASIMDRSVGTARSPAGAAARTTNDKTFHSGTSGAFRSFQGSSTGQGRTVSTLSSRTFTRPSQGSGRSFNSPSRSFNSPPVTNRNLSGEFRGGISGFHARAFGDGGGTSGGGFGGFHGGGGFSGSGGFHGGAHR